ncbi:hypothetical protein [Candidatus Arsenophonus triatominarum]|uniref:hypothetical protein n=1 Tax=Candidatus Arsenophonus triatominarum TaxID=57911 RepID=UPI001650B3DA|nr:hypothetical protein [Candidatus Arsenophonus triatominarum]
MLNKEVFWTSSGNSKILASFSAQVVTTLDEQDKDLRKSKSVKLKKIPILTSD